MNSVNLIGYLAKDPEIRFVGDKKDIAICNFSIGVNEYRGKDKGNVAIWIPCRAFRKTAENIDKHFKKGSKIAVSGTISADDYTDNNGNRIYKNFVMVERFDFAGDKNTGDATGGRTEPTSDKSMCYIPD